jgi:AraC family ethanolamine operon transcriptional activator
LSAGVARYLARLNSFDAVAEAAKGWDLDFLLLGSGGGTGEIEAVATGRAVVQRNRLGWRLLQRGASPQGFCTFGVGVDARQRFPWCGQEVRDDWLLAFPPGGEYRSVSDEIFHGYSLAFDTALVRDTGRLLGLSTGGETFPPAGVFNVGRERIARIRRTVAGIVAAARKQPTGDSSPRLTRAIEWGLLADLLKAFAVGRPAKAPSTKLRTLALRRSTDLIEEATGRPVTVREMCEATGVSWRTLDYAFKEHYGVSPKAYLTARRLNGVRRDLRGATGGLSVGQAASRWGFWHMSQFARDYRRLFGELPSGTLGGKPSHR